MRARAGHRLAADLLAVQAPARPAEAAAPRPRRGRQGAGRRRPRRRCPRPRRCSGPASTPRCAHVADEVAEGMTRPWVAAIRRASVSQGDDFADAARPGRRRDPDLGVGSVPGLVQGGAGAPVAADRSPRSPVGVWLAGLAVMGYLQVSTPDLAVLRRAAAADAAAARRGGRSASCSAWCAGSLVGICARSRARSAEKRLRAPIGEVTERLVVEPIDDRGRGLPAPARGSSARWSERAPLEA